MRIFLKGKALNLVLSAFLILVLQCGILWALEDKNKVYGKAELEQIKEIFINAAHLLYPKDKDIWIKVLDKDKHLLGSVIFTSPYSDKIKGYRGPVPLLIGINKKQKIIGVSLCPNKETPSILKVIKKKGFFDSFTGVFWKDIEKNEYDSITGATRTCEAIIKSLKLRLNILSADIEKKLETE